MMPTDPKLDLANHTTSEAMTKLSTLTQDMNRVLARVEAMHSGQENLAAMHREVLTSLRSLAEGQAALVTMTTRLSDEVLDLRQGVSPGSNTERVLLILSGAAAGGALVSLVFRVFSEPLASYLAFLH